MSCHMMIVRAAPAASGPKPKGMQLGNKKKEQENFFAQIATEEKAVSYHHPHAMFSHVMSCYVRLYSGTVTREMARGGICAYAC